MSQNDSVPSIADIDSDWLTTQIRKAGHNDATVTSFSAEEIGTGQMAKCVRLTLDIHSSDASTPRSLIAKVTSDSEASRKVSNSLPVYRREVEFYQKFRPLLNISTPRSYYAKIADDNLNFLILLEDMAPAEQGNQLLGCTPELVKKAVMELVGLHAPSWNHPSYLDADSPLRPISTPLSFSRDVYVSSTEGFIERHGEALDENQIDIIRELAKHEEPLFTLDETLYSLTHMDYRLDNLLLSPNTGSPDITVVDWQTYDISNPLNDVAYFISSSLPADTRKDVEEDILRAYHEGLTNAGVKNFGWEDCWLAYRKASLYGFIMAIGSAMTVKRTPRGDSMFRLLADRHTRHALDVDAVNLLR